MTSALLAQDVDPEALRRLEACGPDPGSACRWVADTTNSVGLAKAVRGSVDVAIYDEPVTPCGRVEILPFVLEQAVSATNHRFGNPTKLLDGVL